MMYDSWTRGISPQEFRQIKSYDYYMINVIHKEVGTKKEHQQKVAQMVAQMRR